MTTCQYQRSDTVRCVRVAGINSRFCRYHTDPNSIQVCPDAYLHVGTGMVQLSSAAQPEFGDFRFDKGRIVRLVKNHKWRKCCQACWTLGRPNWCNVHNPRRVTSSNSYVSCVFFDMLATELKRPIAHKHVQTDFQSPYAEHAKEICIPGTTFKVDGYCCQEKTCYEFLGDFWHGNPALYPSGSVNRRVGKTFGELHDETFARFLHLVAKGYRVYYCWEHDFKCYMRDLSDTNCPPVSTLLHEVTADI